MAKLDDWSLNFGNWLGSLALNSSVGDAYKATDKKLKNHGTDRFEGQDGFDKKGWPTMKLTVGVVGTVVTAGAFGMYAVSANATTLGLTWQGLTLGTSVYSSIDDGYQMSTGNSLLFSKPVEKFNFGVDLYDAATSRNPISMMNIFFLYVDKYYVDKKK